MPRIRTIKPSFARHEGLQELECLHPTLRPMLTFACLWMACDREGRFAWKPKQLKLDILPFVPFDMGATLELLEGKEFVIRYQVAGKEYGYIPTWRTHQHVNVKESASTIPAPPEHRTKPVPTRGEVEGEKEREHGKEKSKPSAKRGDAPHPVKTSQALGQTKHSRIQGMIFSAYSQENGVEPPWDASEGAQLKKLLDATPGWQDQLYAQCLTNMYRSEGFPPGTRPREFLPWLPKCLKAPLDRFKNQTGAGNGKQQLTSDQRRIISNREAIVSGLTDQDARSDAGHHGGTVPYDDNPRVGKILEAITDPGKRPVT